MLKLDENRVAAKKGQQETPFRIILRYLTFNPNP